MARFITVVTFAFSLLVQASGKTSISSDLSFDCTNDNSMKIFVSKPGLYGSVYAEGAKGTICSVENHPQKDSDYFEIKKCNINETIRVIIMLVIQNGSPDDLVIGGENVLFIDLKCNEVPLGGYVINKTVTFNESSADKNYTLHTESPLYLVMEIQDSRYARLNDAVIVGTVLHLVITGGDEFKFRAETCIASDAGRNHSKILVSNGLPVETHILSKFSNTSINTVSQNVSPASEHKHSLEATLYAFHFANSHDVEIMCIITVCQNNDDTCSLQLTTKSPVSTPPSTTNHTGSTVGRKRRDALGLPQTQTLRTNFRVVDKFEDNNGIVRTSGAVRRAVSWLPLVFLALFAVRTLM